MEASGGAYADRESLLAAKFAKSAARARVAGIIYLGGLGEMGEGLSQHLSSHREVEMQLASTGLPVTTFRAAMIIGAGSASFEILRYLIERLLVRERNSLADPWLDGHVGGRSGISGVIEQRSPFQERVYFILDLKHFLRQTESLERLKIDLFWLPTWHDA